MTNDEDEGMSDGFSAWSIGWIINTRNMKLRRERKRKKVMKRWLSFVGLSESGDDVEEEEEAAMQSKNRNHPPIAHKRSISMNQSTQG
ncbi:hypothetical protein NL676_002375 [Syzygium grande]|nr:hypothetical protein NL676_002375 [Syzygium grande]